MLVCDEHKWIFLRNPKTASRSVTRALRDNFVTRNKQNYHGWKISEPKPFTEVVPFQTADFLFSYPRPQSQELSGYFVFTTVRNPYERVVSGWQYFNKKKGDLNFNEYVNSISGKRKRFPFETFPIRQTDVLDLIRGVHILRYENLEEDFNALPFVGQQIVLPQVGVQTYDDWKSHYTLDLETKVYELLQIDFERLGYKRLNFKEQISLL